MTESGEDVVQSVDEADMYPSRNSQTDLQSLSSPKTEFQGRSTHIPSIEAQPLPKEEDNLLQAAYIVLHTVPRAIEHFIDGEYKGGFLQAICDYKDQLKKKLRSDEWELLDQLKILYHFYDQIIQDTILDNEVLDLLISRCIIRKEDRAEIEHHPRQSDRNKCILDLLIQRPQDSYSVLLDVLKESSTCPKDLIECMEGQLFSHHKVVSQCKVKSYRATLPSLTNRPGFQTLVTFVSVVKAVQISDSEPGINDTSLPADLYRLQSWYKKIIKMSSMDLDKYQQFVQTVKVILVRIGGQNDPVETTLSTVMQKQVQTILDGLKDKEEDSDLKEKIMKIEIEKEEIIPKNIRDQIQKQIEDWKKKDNMFVSTRASDYVMECLQDNSCVTLTAPSGVGKSFISRHTALLLQKKGYKIIPVYSPTDIRDYYQPGKQTIFIVDDICGNFTANQQQIESWKQLLPVINTIIADKSCKIIVSCRLQVYTDEKFNILSPFKSCECNLISDELGLTSVEKRNIANTYIGTSMQDIDDLSQNCDCFPLLCSLYHDKKDVDVREFFINPFNVYKNELDKLSEHGDEGNYKLSSLALCVLLNNHIEEKWFLGKVTERQNQIITDTYNACGLDRSISKAKLQHALDTLDGTFICKKDGIYRTTHDKLFDFLAHYFGQKKMIECLIDHGDSDLVHERFIWQKSPDDKSSNIDFIIKIPDDYLKSYLERFIKDWSEGKVSVVFNNINMKVSSFRQKLLQYLLKIDKSEQITLANAKDTVIPKEEYGSGSAPLIWTCCDGYTDMVQWMLHNDVDVDQFRDDEVTGLNMASQHGHTDIVKLLLKKNTNVDLCDNNGCSPLFMASQNGHTDIVRLLLERNPHVDICQEDGMSHLFMASQEGHTDIVRLLLEKNPNVDLCNKDGCSPLFMASYKGHTDIVRLLLEKNPNVDLCDKDGFTPLIVSCSRNNTSIVQLLIKHKPDINAQTYDGGNALLFSVLIGNIEITQLLLENNADCNICAYSKHYVIDTLTNHPWKTLDKEKQDIFDSIVKEALPHVADYVSKKSIDYAFDVVAGCSPLHFACFMGSIDVVRCLLYHNAIINIKKENGTTPLCFACEVGHEDIVCLLLDRGADLEMCRLDGKSPLNIATENGHKSIVMIVTEHMKKEGNLS